MKVLKDPGLPGLPKAIDRRRDWPRPSLAEPWRPSEPERRTGDAVDHGVLARLPRFDNTGTERTLAFTRVGVEKAPPEIGSSQRQAAEMPMRYPLANPKTGPLI